MGKTRDLFKKIKDTKGTRILYYPQNPYPSSIRVLHGLVCVFTLTPWP